LHELIVIAVFPIFNFTNHTLHGVDTQKYYDALTDEDKEIIKKRFEEEANKKSEEEREERAEHFQIPKPPQ